MTVGEETVGNTVVGQAVRQECLIIMFTVWRPSDEHVNGETELEANRDIYIHFHLPGLDRAGVSSDVYPTTPTFSLPTLSIL